ncbi:MAG: ankyrin repeat domain-containing protein [Planctomycetota bacterium]|jgi:ankyrin repeat protein
MGNALGRTLFLLEIVLVGVLTSGCRKTLDDAVRSGDLGAVQRLIRKGTDVNARNKDGETALHIAARRNREHIAELLIANGADVNAREEDGWTPLHQAAMNSRWSARVGRLLILKGADINARTSDNITPLHAAAMGGNASTVRLLIEKGADVNARDKAGDTPLHWAARCKYDTKATVEALLSGGAEIMATNSMADAPVENAISWGNRTMARLLVEAMDLGARDASGDTVLHWAVRQHSPKVLNLLIEHGADVNAKDARGNTALDLAIRIGNEEIIRLLERKGAKKTRSGEPEVTSPVISEKELFEKVKRIASEGGDLNAPLSVGAPPLHIAAMYGYRDVIEFMLKHGTSVNAKASNSMTALHVAAMYRQVEAGKLLIGGGANVNAASEPRGQTPLHLALARSQLELARVLVSHGAEVHAKTQQGLSPLHIAVTAQENAVELAALLIEAGADMNVPGPLAGGTPLHTAVPRQSAPLLRLLLTKGADPSARDDTGGTPLHHAARLGYGDMLELLIEAGSVVNAIDNDGMTPLDWAVAVGEEGAAAAEVLRKHGGKAAEQGRTLRLIR